MCKSSKSCVIVRDTGLSTAFTITHEIGHRYILAELKLNYSIIINHILVLEFIMMVIIM